MKTQWAVDQNVELHGHEWAHGWIAMVCTDSFLVVRSHPTIWREQWFSLDGKAIRLPGVWCERTYSETETEITLSKGAK